MISRTRVSKNSRWAGTSEDAQVRRPRAHQDRGDEPGVVTDDVAGGRPRPTRRSWLVVASRSFRLELHRHNRQHRHADYPRRPRRRGGQQGLAQRVGDPAAGARQHGVEHHRAQDAANRSISEPSQDSIRCRRSEGRTKASSGAYHRRPGHHRRSRRSSAPPGPDMPSSEAGQHRGERHRDRYTPDRPGEAPPGAARPCTLPQLQRQAGVIQDHRHRERDQRLERWAEQALRVDVVVPRPR